MLEFNELRKHALHKHGLKMKKSSPERDSDLLKMTRMIIKQSSLHSGIDILENTAFCLLRFYYYLN